MKERIKEQSEIIKAIDYVLRLAEEKRFLTAMTFLAVTFNRSYRPYYNAKTGEAFEKAQADEADGQNEDGSLRFRSPAFYKKLLSVLGQ
jgi:hypothetical protein